MTFEKAVPLVQAARFGNCVYNAELREALAVIASQQPDESPSASEAYEKYIDGLQEAFERVRPMIRTLEQLAAWLLFSVSVIFVYGTLVML